MAPPLAHSLTALDMIGRTNSGYMMEIQDFKQLVKKFDTRHTTEVRKHFSVLLCDNITSHGISY